MLGTLAYMSPEQAAGREMDHRTDIFSLGVVLHEILSGRRPFQGSSSVEILHAIMHDAPPPLAGIPPELDEILAKSLAKDLKDRYRHAGDFELEPQVTGEHLVVVRPLVNATFAARRPLEVFDRVGQINAADGDARLVERFAKQTAGRADERLALPILDVARLLADEHDIGALVAGAEDRLRAAAPEIAALARGRPLAHVAEREPIDVHLR